MIRKLPFILLLSLFPPSLFAQTIYRQAGALQLVDGPVAPIAAQPYASVLNVSGAKGIISRLTLTLHGFTHTNPDAVDLLLVAPDGTSSVVLSDAGGAADINGITLVLDESAASPVPDFATYGSGTYRPVNWGSSADRWPAPAAMPPHGTAGLLPFRGLDPNGGWKLFAVNDVDGSEGTVSGGWSLSFETVNANQPASFSDVEGTCTASGNSVLVTWSTTHEYNSSYFIVERQVGNGFTEIGRVPAAGFTTEESSYSFTDQNGNGCKGVYRLRLVFRDGSSKTSNAVSVKPASTSAMRLYPNPALNYLMAEPAAGTETLRLSFTDASGQLRLLREGVAAAGRPLRLELNLPPGRYYVRKEGSHEGQWVEIASSE